MFDKKNKNENIKNLGEHDALPSFDMTKYKKNNQNKDNKKLDKVVKDDKAKSRKNKNLKKENVEEVDKLIIDDLGVNKHKIKMQKNIDFGVKKISYFMLLILIIATIVFAVRFIKFNATYMIWRTNVAKGSENINNKSIKYSLFKNGLMRVSNDGITYIDTNGVVKWTISYNMKEPIFVSNKNYFAIADKNGNVFYTFNELGLVATNTTTNPIEKISISSDGMLYLLQNDENSSYINLYNNNEKTIETVVETTFTEGGIPMDISASNSGEQLLVCNTCLSGNDVYSKATYYDFSYVDNNSKKIIGEFIDEFDDKFLARGHFFDDKNSCLIYDGGVIFVSTADKSNPRITKTIEFSDMIHAISYNKKYLALVFDNNVLKVFNNVGNMLCDKKIDFEYESFYLCEDYEIFLNENRVMIYDERGRMMLDKELNGSVQYVAKRKNLIFTELLVGFIDAVECIRFY